MKQRTSITLSQEVLTAIDRLAGSQNSRSACIERILRRFLRDKARAELQARDLELINRNAERLNQEAGEVLQYQAVTICPASTKQKRKVAPIYPR